MCILFKHFSINFLHIIIILQHNIVLADIYWRYPVTNLF